MSQKLGPYFPLKSFTAFGQECGNFPEKLKSPNKTSAIPSPSEPGNQAATNASDFFICFVTTKGLPEIKTTIVLIPFSEYVFIYFLCSLVSVNVLVFDSCPIATKNSA